MSILPHCMRHIRRSTVLLRRQVLILRLQLHLESILCGSCSSHCFPFSLFFISSTSVCSVHYSRILSALLHPLVPFGAARFQCRCAAREQFAVGGTVVVLYRHATAVPEFLILFLSRCDGGAYSVCSHFRSHNFSVFLVLLIAFSILSICFIWTLQSKAICK
jgi:hypothetical protein